MTITGSLSESDHFRHVISDSVRSFYALRVLRHHGLTSSSSQSCRGKRTYPLRGTDVLKLLTANESTLPDFDKLLEESVDQLFQRTIGNPNHTLFPQHSTASQNHQLRHFAHDRQWPAHQGNFVDYNFIIRLLYKKNHSNLVHKIVTLSGTSECRMSL